MDSSYNGEAILVNAQGGNNTTANSDNGIYIVGDGPWSRSPYLILGDLATGTSTVILNGNKYSNHEFVCTSGAQENPVFIGDPVIWSIRNVPYSLGEGLSRTFVNNQTVISVDSSLNFIQYLDNTNGPNPDTIYIGTNTNTVNIGKTTTVISGNVGIGTNSPAYNLDVTGGIRATSTLDLKTVTGDAANSWISIRPDASGNYIESGTQNGGSSNNYKLLIFSGINAQNQTMCIDPANVRVGINNNSPNYTLDVNGSVNATSYNSSSDYRIKENVAQLDSKFVVDNLNPVTYLNNNLGKQDIGLIAHELQEIFPELVNGEKDGEQFQSVNYIGLIPILIKEIQELKKEIKLVKTELNELKNK